MDISKAQQAMLEKQVMKDFGIALVSASAVLALFLLLPLRPASVSPPAVAAVAAAPAPNAFANVPIAATAAIVFDLATGAPLYSKNADAQLPLASLTKLLAVYAALTELAPQTPVTISATAVQAEAPHLFRAGQVVALNDLARLTLTASLNDGAVAIIEAAAAKSSRSETELLSQTAADLHLFQTYAVNGNGLDVSTTVSGGYGSARDMARLAGALVDRAPAIALATTHASASAVSRGGTPLTVTNTDPMVGTIPHLLLSKTGYTDLAGGNLALVFDVGINHPVAVVVLGSSIEERFTDGMALVAATLAHFAGVASL